MLGIYYINAIVHNFYQVVISGEVFQTINILTNYDIKCIDCIINK